MQILPQRRRDAEKCLLVFRPLRLHAYAVKVNVPKAPWTAAAWRRLGAPPGRYCKAASSRRNPRRFAHFL